jgi:hypothetical protein
MAHDHTHSERFCAACENGTHSYRRDYSRNTVRALAAERKRVEKRHKEVLSLRERVDELDRQQLQLYHSILQNERLAALESLRHFAQEANADIQAAKDALADVEASNRSRGYDGVQTLRECVEDANKAVYRLRNEITAASAELLEVIALEDEQPLPEEQVQVQTSPVRQVRISSQGDIDVTFDQQRYQQAQYEQPQYQQYQQQQQQQQQQHNASSLSGYGSVQRTPSHFASPSPRRFTTSPSAFELSSGGYGGDRSGFGTSQLRLYDRPTAPSAPAVYHPYDRGSFNRSPATERFVQSSPGLRNSLSFRHGRFEPSGSVGFNVHEAADVSVCDLVGSVCSHPDCACLPACTRVCQLAAACAA